MLIKMNALFLKNLHLVEQDECTDSQELTTEVGSISDGQVFDTLPIF